MAVLVRFSCFFTRPSCLPSPPSDHFSDKPHVAGYVDEFLHILSGFFVFSEWEWKMKLIWDCYCRKLNRTVQGKEYNLHKMIELLVIKKDYFMTDSYDMRRVLGKDNLVCRKLVSLLFKEKKFASVLGNASRFIHQRFDGHHDLEGSQDFSKMPPPSDNFVDKLSADQQGKVLLKSTAMTFFLTNAFMLTTPFKALAETCEADNSFFNMPLLLLVALIGATVGGLLARQRRGEMQRLNDQLRQINTALRRQAKIESYAPNLSYAPVGSRISESEVIVDPRKQELISRLKTGKNFLRNQNPEKAYAEFKAALDLAENLKDPIEEKKAARGLGASLQRQGKYREAIKYHSMVLEISHRQGEDSGNTEAYGAIADCYTELGDLERAGKFYDQYIARLETD
ncbi:hypothetical protein Pint_29191 [Pistacia integerrima]|uniref:Uncharacterized protein n=1 Tax=Pistacia integerrima TaxID=434235 RepID=A0ACC0X137_9ROSI|nr:hypothetical protein Pint_29191 [Pistacia integerrima]